MDLTFLPALVAGGIVALISSLIAGAVQNHRDTQKRSEDRVLAVEDRQRDQDDQNRAQGREEARAALEDLVNMRRAAEIDPSFSGSNEIAFPSGPRHDIREHARLINDEAVRQGVMNAIGMLPAVGAADHELKATIRATQGQLLASAEAILAAYVRGDPTPPEPLRYIENVRAIVDKVWATAAANGELYPLW